MAAEKRRQNPAVKQTLFEESYRFNFFKAVHLLEGLAGGQTPGWGLSQQNDPIRFRVPPGFGFPASDITAITNGTTTVKPEVVVNFMGLIGPKGVLPDWYNEHAQARVFKKDYAFTDFLDIFHHRLISLFYRAWKKYRLAENFRPDGGDSISRSLADLVGLHPGIEKSEPDFFQCARKRLIFFAGMVSRCVPTVAAMEAVVAHAVGAQAEVEQFVPRMLAVHEHDRTRLGIKNSTLKQDALCGARIRDSSTYFILKLGPLSWDKYLAFQPQSRNLSLVSRLITLLAGIEYEFEIHLVLKGPQIPSLCLGGRLGPPILGRTVLLRKQELPYPHDIVLKVRAGSRGAAEPAG
jgi:type VI secretion system protein ImpH